MDCFHDLVLWQSWSSTCTPARLSTARRRSVLQLPPLGSSHSALAFAGAAAGGVVETLAGTWFERAASWPTVKGGAGATPAGRFDLLGLPTVPGGKLAASTRRRCTKFGLGAAGAAAFALGRRRP